ncbi:hypothetical protein HBI56_199120 [Parastagonospora nodorum]|uniref:Uncharacterized protein n=1 Tax=Phaeosphaeria nodorum (strain SN15 / ATCC MYA-4574 / FGSC 10173) TaxID=321614 RepID=A0A7U2I4M8_PHANO|nr:hypothetical protein HBH56_204110 [Parastagonospora nodorum]QRD01700.1 hypothetical protein JI435_417160 [Parastagonospora nodorum SN15]KAH3923934.1 hypothetical protein HBH54_202990 [Parastagonospora nodorum]KAH3941446.1 hypothetical protein HBH53_201340 [Parastagonospora nodorum]KAH3959583.1 hypothetical protein HBH51_199200 [Parastagonospora nodorum]
MPDLTPIICMFRHARQRGRPRWSYMSGYEAGEEEGLIGFADSQNVRYRTQWQNHCAMSH